MSDCEANIWKPRVECDNVFDGPDPTLLDGNAAIIIGSDDSGQAHIAAGPTTAQAKANATTVAKMFLNSLGGDVDIGGTDSLVQAWNSVTSLLERVLTLSDRFFPINPDSIADTTHTVGADDIGWKTEVSNASAVAFTIDNTSVTGVTANQECLFYVSGAGGISAITAGGSQTLIAPAGGTAVAQGRTVSLQYLGSNNWLYTGP